METFHTPVCLLSDTKSVPFAFIKLFRVLSCPTFRSLTIIKLTVDLWDKTTMRKTTTEEDIFPLASSLPFFHCLILEFASIAVFLFSNFPQN